MEEKFVLKEEFIKQAQEISRGAELLPGGVKRTRNKIAKIKRIRQTYQSEAWYGSYPP